jgi:hypothetical protein
MINCAPTFLCCCRLHRSREVELDRLAKSIAQEVSATVQPAIFFQIGVQWNRRAGYPNAVVWCVNSGWLVQGGFWPSANMPTACATIGGSASDEELESATQEWFANSGNATRSPRRFMAPPAFHSNR